LRAHREHRVHARAHRYGCAWRSTVADGARDGGHREPHRCAVLLCGRAARPGAATRRSLNMARPDPREPHWLTRPDTIRKLWWIFGVVLALAVVAQFVVPLVGHCGARSEERRVGKGV